MNFQYVWLYWSSAFLVPWLGLWLLAPAFRTVMLRASLLTMPFGLVEPLFVPAYWNPPSVFDLAQRTRFDLESLVSCFALGGTGAALYNALTRRQLRALPASEHSEQRHRWHRAVLVTPVLTFVALYFLPWNPIYAGIVAMVAGGVATAWCRTDLARKTLIGGAIFLGYYAVFMAALVIFTPGYIDRVWNVQHLSGNRIAGIPIEELAVDLRRKLTYFKG